MGSMDTGSARVNGGTQGQGSATEGRVAPSRVQTAPSVQNGLPARPLEGKIALVTGASRGIGQAVAIELARAGAAVALNYRTGAEQAQALASEIGEHGGKALPVYGDVSVEADVRQMIEQVLGQWGRIDILVNNSGINRDRTLRKMVAEDWMAVINTNLNSVFYTTSSVLPGMIERNYGRIITIASVVGQAGNYGQANYAAAKGGLIAFTKSAALELARYNITVNVVAPGFTATDMVAKIPEDIQTQIKAKIPLGRFALPREIAQAVLFLAAYGDYTTGQQININGGIYM
jgi:acetoacetyl-CoA reductase